MSLSTPISAVRGGDQLETDVPPELLATRCCEMIIGTTMQSVRATVLACALVVAVMFPVVDGSLLAAWTALLLGVLASRALLVRAWGRRVAGGGDTMQHFQARYQVGIALTGLLWGSVMAFLFTPQDAPRQQFLSVVLIGVGAVGMTTLAIDRRCVRVFLATMLLPMAVRYLSMPDPVERMLGVMALFYMVFAMGNAERLRASLLENLRLEVRAAEREQRLNQAQQVARLGSFDWDPASGAMRWSDEHCRLWGVPTGNRMRDRAAFMERIHPDDRAAVEDAVRQAVEHGTPAECVHRVLWPDRTEYYIRARIEPVRDRHGRLVRLVGTVQNISEQREAEDRMRRLAFHDVLTGLPNRHLLTERLQLALQRQEAESSSGALIFIDLDNFKYLNDTHGHDRGDELLRLVARRVLAAVRRSDTVARLGGDEFVVMLEHLDADPAHAELQAGLVAEQIRASIQAPYMLAGREFHSSSSIGIAAFRGSGLTVDELMKRADLAMYQAKGAGRNAVCLFKPELEERASARSAIEADLRTALQKDEFTLHLQPQVDTTGRWTGAEALLRWQHPVRGAVSPAQMIPVAEESGLILPIGQWVLRTACQHLVRWAADPALAPLTLAVNVSARQFRQPQFAAEVLAMLRETGADPRRLKIELTETLLLHDLEESIRKMSLLKTQGVGFALDDFGTGYSSLSYLQRLPLEQIKIDQVFVRDVLVNANNAAIVRMVLSLGRTFGLDVIAEGVESTGQRDFLAKGGCHGYQGYLFGRPVPVSEFEARMHATAAASLVAHALLHEASAAI
ncbi:MAG: EAL domain-containing protein [Pseudomonadota bacterium]|nr:EAL domain-containing protein [Pseudomonadota bacterium]